jgi:hypothetical protein
VAGGHRQLHFDVAQSRDQRAQSFRITLLMAVGSWRTRRSASAVRDVEVPTLAYALLEAYYQFMVGV